jgi:hypothetical protein
MGKDRTDRGLSVLVPRWKEPGGDPPKRVAKGPKGENQGACKPRKGIFSLNFSDRQKHTRTQNSVNRSVQTLSRLHTLVSAASHLSVPCCCYVPHDVVPLPWSYSGSGSVAMHATAHCVGVVILSTCPCRLLPTATLNSSTDSGVCSMLCTQGLPLAAERIAGSASRGRMASHSDKKQRWCLTLGPYHNRLSPPQHRGGSNASESIEYLGAPPGKRKALLPSSSSSSLQT